MFPDHDDEHGALPIMDENGEQVLSLRCYAREAKTWCSLCGVDYGKPLRQVRFWASLVNVCVFLVALVLAQVQDWPAWVSVVAWCGFGFTLLVWATAWQDLRWTRRMEDAHDDQWGH